MKKLLFVFLFITSILADNIKTNYFIGAEGGVIKYTSNTSKENIFGLKIGGYFYDKNIYKISNRLYITIDKSEYRNTNNIIANLNLDWIWTQIPYIKPFIGISAGYLYESTYPTSLYGFNSGIIIYIGDIVELEFGGKINRPLENNDIYTDNFKQLYGSINFSF